LIHLIDILKKLQAEFSLPGLSCRETGRNNYCPVFPANNPCLTTAKKHGGDHNADRKNQ
jgi:hypothetical protein